MALNERDLKRILTTEERNAITIMAGRKPGDVEMIARRHGLSVDRLRELTGRAREKIERESRRGGRGVTTAIEEVQCGCGTAFTPRRKGELQCPACRELNGDGRPLIEHRSNGRSDHRESDHESVHESAHESAQLGGPEASPDEAPDNGNVARNPSPARPFQTVADVQARRAKIEQALRDLGGEANAAQLKAATGVDSSTFGNDITRLVTDRRVVKVTLGPRRALYRTPEFEGAAPAPDGDDRREQILDYIAEHEGALTMDVSRRFPALGHGTILNDLDKLHASGQLVKFRGALVRWRVADGEEGEPPYFEQPVERGLTDAERADAARAALIEAEGDAAERVAIQGNLDPEAEDPSKPPSDLEPDPGEGETPVPPPTPEPGDLGPDPEPRLLDTPEGKRKAEQLLVEVDRSKRSAAELAMQLYEEAELAARHLDVQVPETLLRGRYIAALLSRIEAGDTSPDLLDRFERLAFGDPA